MAQDPEADRGECRPAGGPINTSHSLDTVALFRSATVDAEIEAGVIRGLLESHGIPSLMQRAAGYPLLGFEVHVSRANLREAEQLVEEAKAAGPRAAMEAHQESEEGR